MTNADKFKNIFGLYATELWSMPAKDFLKWLNSKVVSCSEFPNNSDTIYRQQAIDFVGSMNMCDEISNEACKKLTSYLDELPSAEPYTTTHDSIPAETGGNDDDRTSGDCISRRQAIDEIHEDAEWLASQGSDWQVERMERDKSILMSLPSVQPETNCSEIPNNSDTISRQAVTKFLNDWLSCLFENCHKQSASDLKMIIKDFKNLPSVQPEREKGEWVYNSPVTMKCNRCGLVIKDWDWHRFKICPNCGADMRGEKDG